MKRKKLLLLLILFITVIFTTTGCKQDNMDDIRILVTNYPNEYITERLYGDHATITSVYPDGVDTEKYQIKKKQKAIMREIVRFMMTMGKAKLA